MKDAEPETGSDSDSRSHTNSRSHRIASSSPTESPHRHPPSAARLAHRARPIPPCGWGGSILHRGIDGGDVVGGMCGAPPSSKLSPSLPSFLPLSPLHTPLLKCPPAVSCVCVRARVFEEETLAQTHRHTRRRGRVVPLYIYIYIYIYNRGRVARLENI